MREIYDKEFIGQDMSSDQLSEVNYANCKFEQSSFSKMEIRKCKFTECIFENCNLNFVKLNGSSFVDVTFKNCKLLAVNWTEASWPTPKMLFPLEFRECTLNHSTFFGLNIPNTKFIKCLMKGVDLTEADAAGVDFYKSDLQECIFHDTILKKASFIGAKNYNLDLMNNEASKAIFSLPEAVALLYHLDIELQDYE